MNTNLNQKCIFQNIKFFFILDCILETCKVYFGTILSVVLTNNMDFTPTHYSK